MATPKTVAPADHKHYVWWFPGSPVKVHLDLQVVQRLKQRLGNAGTGVSECGLLFGGSRDGATEILDFQPALSAGVPDMIASLPTELKRRLIGYYRTEETESLHLNAQDLALAEKCFKGPNQVFLMMHANGFGPPAATFFFRDRDGSMAEFGFLEFPLDPSLLAMEGHDRALRSRDTAVEQPVAIPSPPADDGRRMQRRSPWKAAAWICSAALILALGVVLIGAARRGQIPALWRAITNPLPTESASISVVQASAHPIIALHVIRKNGDLELTWDRESPLIAAATSGLITIQDGESKRLLPLNSAQLYGGPSLLADIGPDYAAALVNDGCRNRHRIGDRDPAEGGGSAGQASAGAGIPRTYGPGVITAPQRYPGDQAVQTVRCRFVEQGRVVSTTPGSSGPAGGKSRRGRTGHPVRRCIAITHAPAAAASQSCAESGATRHNL